MNISDMEQSIDAVLAALDDPNEEVRLEAIRVLGRASRSSVREAGLALIPRLIGVLQKRDQYGQAKALDEARFLIIRIADVPGVLSRVIQELEDQQEGVRLAAMDILNGMLSSNAQEVLPSILKATRDKSPQVRWKAAGALGSPWFKPDAFGPEARQAVPPLIAMLKHKDPWVRGLAVPALANIGPHARAALPALIKEVKKEVKKNGDLRIVDAIGNMGPEQGVVKALVQMFRFLHRGALFHPAGTALAKIGPQPVVMQHLISALKDRNHLVRAGAADALAQIGPGGSEAVSTLTELLESENYGKVTAAALRALGKIGPQAEAATAQLVEMAAGKDRASRGQDQSLLVKAKRTVLWRLLFFKEEFRRPWSYPRLDDPNSDARAFTLKLRRRDAAITILQVTSESPAASVAIATLSELWNDPYAGLDDYYLRLFLGQNKLERVKEMLQSAIRLPADSTTKYPPQC